MNIQQDNPVTDANSAPAKLVSVGAALREAREQLGLSVADVANRIKFAPKQIEWLEADDYVRLPEAAFVRGFVRSYARLVEVDSARLLAALPSSHVQSAAQQEVKSVEIPMPGTFTARRYNIMWLAAALVIAVSLAIFERSHDRAPVESKTAVVKSAVETIDLPDGMVDGASAPEAGQPQAAEGQQGEADSQVVVVAPAKMPHPIAAPATPSAEAVKPLVKKTPTAEVSSVAKPSPSQVKVMAAAVKPAVTAPTVPAANVQPVIHAAKSEKAQTSAPTAVAEQAKNQAVSEHVLRIELDEEAWVEVKDSSDKALVGKMFAAGSLVRVTGKGPMQLTLGNAHAVRLFDNGKQVNLERYTTAEVAKVKLK
jgi:cytoskeleton protein RodZ